MVAFNNKRAKFQKRRAISTIVGGAIFLILFASAFSTFFIAMDFQRDSINTQRAISESIMEKTKEDFAISVSTDDDASNTLAIQVKNQGVNPVEIGNIWIVNKSGDYPAEKHLINYTDSIIPPGYGSNILENTHLTMITDDYDVKVVSTLGTIKKAELSVGSSNNLRTELIAIPPEVKIGQNVTLIFHVENIGNSRILNVSPLNDTGTNHPNINPEFTTPHPAEPMAVDLDPGEGAFFTWKYETTGTADTFVNFNANASGTEEITGFVINSNTAYNKIKLKEPDISETIVLTQDLISRPEIFMIIPGPFGDDANLGLWGMNIVNPTAQPMEVTKIAISALSTRSSPNDQIFPTACGPQPISPQTGTWSCPSPNQLVWDDAGNPVIIPPFSISPFITKALPGLIQLAPFNLEAVVIQANVFTTVGEFGKSAYATSFDYNPQIIANVFLTNVTETSAIDTIIGNVTNIAPASTVKFNATIADFSTNSLTKIETGRLIVNVPKGWSVPTNIVANGFNAPVVSSFTDGSHQIIGTLSGPIDGSTVVERTIQFDSDAPDVTSTQMYVMYILGEGTATNGFAVSPLAEVILHVKP